MATKFFTGLALRGRTPNAFWGMGPQLLPPQGPGSAPGAPSRDHSRRAALGSEWVDIGLPGRRQVR